MKHWTQFLPKECPNFKGQREAIMANHHAIERLVGQIHHIQKENIKLEQELCNRACKIFTEQEMEAAFKQETITEWICEQDQPLKF